jgi:hypothetical protein
VVHQDIYLLEINLFGGDAGLMSDKGTAVLMFPALPSGHFVTALPLNFSVIALSFAGLVILRIMVPRSMAVFLSACSVCSKPWRNKTGSVSAMLTVTPPPEATGFSSGSDLMLLMTLLADDLPDER